MGYLVNSRFVEGLSNDAIHRQSIVEVRSGWRSGKPFGFVALVETIAEAYIAAGYQLEEVQNASKSPGDSTGVAVSRPLPMAVPPTSTTPMPPPSMATAPPLAPSTSPEPMNLDAIAKLREELHAYIHSGDRDPGIEDAVSRIVVILEDATILAHLGTLLGIALRIEHLQGEIREIGEIPVDHDQGLLKGDVI